MALAILASGAVQAQSGPAAGQPPQPAISTTHHQVQLGQGSIAYTATVSEVMLNDLAGRPTGIGTATAYVRDGVADPAHRPVIFFFNGGPGASSSPLHLAFGPRTVTSGAGAPMTIVDNPSSLIAVADLVFIDPVGTGFSRPVDGASGAPFWSVDGDALSVAQIIRQQIAALGRVSSPHYLFGESYGGVRAATLLHLAPDIRFDGVLLISPALDLSGGDPAPGNDLPYILALPSYAAIAWRHGLGPKQAASAEQAFEMGERFAQSDYALALLKGDSLPASAREDIARRLSALIGAPEPAILQHDLRLDVETFRRALLQGKGRIIGRLDGSVTGAMEVYDKAKPPGDDPAMSGPGRPSPKLVLDRYYRTELAFPAPAAVYKTLALDVNAQWRWGFGEGGDRFYADLAPYLGEALRRDPNLRLFAAGAIYDLATPLGATTYALNHAGAPTARVRIDRFVSGHMIEDDPAGLAKLRADAIAFITADPAPGTAP